MTNDFNYDSVDHILSILYLALVILVVSIDYKMLMFPIVFQVAYGTIVLIIIKENQYLEKRDFIVILPCLPTLVLVGRLVKSLLESRLER